MISQTITGKVALVTGASSGIGEAIALDLAKAGAKVFVTARREDRLAAVVAKHSGNIIPIAADLTDKVSIDNLFTQISHQGCGLHYLINNAGVGYKSTFSEGDTDQWKQMVDLNILALAICSQKALRLFPETGGHIINISSMAGHRVPPGGGIYSATKHAVKAITEGLRAELSAGGSKTRVSSVSPGIVETPFFDNYFLGNADAAKEMVTKLVPLQPQDVARSVRFAIESPAHVGINDILIRAIEQTT